MASYINRYVAFLDILGFKDLISQTVGEKPTVTVDDIRLILEMPEPAQEAQIVLGGIGDISKSDHRVTAFSDSIIISTDETAQGLIHLLQHVAKIGFYLVRRGVLYRGGITNGLTYHDDNQVFGPAVLEAIKIKQQAVFPRVLLSASTVEAGKAAAVRSFFDRFTRTDCDQALFVNYLRVWRMVADSGYPTPDDMKLEQKAIQAKIDQQLERFPPGTSERIKWMWFSSYFNWAIDDSWLDTLSAPFPAA